MKTMPSTNQAFLPVALFALSSLGIIMQFQSSLLPPPRNTSSRRATPVDHVEENSIALALTTGDLPGYTGWARPSHTLAGLFDSPPELLNAPAMVGKNLSMRIHCTLPPRSKNMSHNGKYHCHDGGMLFFVRAYGRAVLPGRVLDHHNGTYDITVFPLDPGQYTLEVVLAFSTPPPFDSFPLLEAKERPAYEGFLLPGFPITLDVLTSFLAHGGQGHHETSTQLCTLQELLDDSMESAVETGRWLVTEKIASRPNNTSNALINDNQVSLQGYQKGVNSLGITMDYAPLNCSLLSEKAAIQSLMDCATTGKRKLHVIFIGDSNIKMQRDFLGSLLLDKKDTRDSILQTTRISTHGGLVQTLPNVSHGLEIIRGEEKLEDQHNNVEYFILFNSGLHDISQHCNRPNNNQKDSKHMSCMEEYKESLQKLIKLVVAFPAKLRVFQTTTAGWPKYGNYGFAWPTGMPQTLPRDPTFVEYFNHAAWNVLADHNYTQSVFVMDGYWLTLARPDHREVNKNHAIGKHLVHAGPEVLSVLVRKWIMLILESASCSAVH